MSVLIIRLQIGGIAAIEAALARLSAIQGGTLLEGLARQIRDQVRERLISGGPAPDGAAWAPNLEGRRPILHRSGALARSIDYAVSSNQAIIGSGLIYAAIHQFGGTIRPKDAERLAFRIGNRQIFARQVTMPARPYIGLSADDRAELVQTAAAYLRSLFG